MKSTAFLLCCMKSRRFLGEIGLFFLKKTSIWTDFTLIEVRLGLFILDKVNKRRWKTEKSAKSTAFFESLPFLNYTNIGFEFILSTFREHFQLSKRFQLFENVLCEYIFTPECKIVSCLGLAHMREVL